ncbi:glycosyltransferase family 57 protein [Phlebiopsis gigantea 11061_1 CR5-6]|uniref:Alpha-1,3-glucosyltransferase n=1 Tax=Phlebiopsis gigantea (strain 11061_1 CR5-6) TaxID=745531 RepID=A0A0C3RZY8_PHLG1|nr:glycosyltransferase family 57 protein [Phlebiopsis gigantea 11061_1 CR5-6]
MYKQGLRHHVIPLIILSSALIKWCIGLGSYSGRGTAPMFGDYEAQRHWMELTIHLPTNKWYTYDLQYWGLDYPPLTAYVSWLCGIMGSWIDSSWLALDASRGIETQGSKNFMRSTVLLWDALTYTPAVLYFVKIWLRNRSPKTQHVATMVLLLQPALLLVDFGHFQYNSVMLGFTLLAMSFFAAGRDLWGAVFFVLSLGFKQMALYYAPAIGSYLIAKCLSLGPHNGPKLFIRLGLVTTASFAVIFLPFLPPLSPFPAILQPIHRIFPFQRGLFEDKVANFWCASNVVLKWRIWMQQDTLIKLSALFTVAGFLPGIGGMIYSGYKLRATYPAPVLPLLPYALLTSSMSFFLFSFQVHEKTILVPLLPLTLLLSGAASSSFTFQLGALVNNVALFSMWPLLQRDGLALQYIAAMLLWNRLIGYNPFKLRQKSLMEYFSVTILSLCTMLHVLEIMVPPSPRLPDIYPVLNVLLSTPVFGITWLWSIKRSIEVSWGLGVLGLHTKPQEAIQSEAGSIISVEDDRSLVGGNSSGVGLVHSASRSLSLRTRSLGYGAEKRPSLRSGSFSGET